MKKREKEALKKAFDIPDPQCKEEFLNRIGFKKNNAKQHISNFMRYASMAAFAAIMVSMVANINLTADFPDKFTSDKNVIPTISTSASSTSSAEEIPPATTSFTVEESRIAIRTTVSAANTNAEYETPTTAVTREIPAETTESPPTSIATKPPNIVAAHTVTTSVKTESSRLTQQTTQTKPQPAATIQPEPTTMTSKTIPVTTDAAKTTDESERPHTTTKANSIDAPPATTLTSPSPSVDVSGVDLTVLPTSVYEPSDMIIDKNQFDVDHGCSAAIPSDDVTNAFGNIAQEELYNNSAYVFRGIIEEKIYTDISGQPYTLENIVITDVCKSLNDLYNYKKKDKISIYVPGGYIPVKTYAEANNVTCDYPDNYTIYSDGRNHSTQNVGEEYYFFLNIGTDNMPVGAFRLTTENDISIFRLDGSYLVSLGKSDLKIPLNSL